MAWFLVCFAASLASAAVRLEGEPSRYFDLGGDVVRVDSAESMLGCVDVPVRRARIERSRSIGEEAVFLGTSEEDVRSASGRDLRGARWDTVATRRACRLADGTSVSVRVGRDELAVFVPSGEAGSAVVTINGGIVDVPLSRIGDPAAYEGIAPRVSDPAAFSSGIETLGALSGAIDSPPVVPQGTTCFWPCFRCGVAAAGLIVGGTAGLAATCGAAVATAGGLTAACIAGIVTYFAGATAVVDACLSCDQCINPKPPSGGGSGGGGGTQGGPDCAPGYHGCCGNGCCPDSSSDDCG